MTKIRCVIVDDEELARQLLAEYLSEYDTIEIVAECSGGRDAIKKIDQFKADLVFLDVQMPGMDGFTFTRTLRSTRGWEDVPVVIMTSRGDDADQRAGLDAGASAYLLKSEFDQHELVETVRRLVGR